MISVEPIREILPLENSDNLQIAKVFDWEVVVRKNTHTLPARV